MKQISFILCLILLLLFIGGCKQNSEISNESTPTTQESNQYGIPTFKLEDYQDDIDLSGVNGLNINVGTVDSPKSAQQKAKQIWLEYMKYDDYGGKDLQVYFDPNTDCWLVILAIVPTDTEIPLDESWPVLDCEPCAIFKTNGDLLAIWTR